MLASASTSLISGSAPDKPPCQASMLRSQQRATQKWKPFIKPPWLREVKTMAHLAFARTITPTITQLLCSTLMVTTLKLSVTGQADNPY
jgi:hypothetical protein